MAVWVGSTAALEIPLGGARAIYSGTLDAWFYERFHKTEGELTYHQAISKINVVKHIKPRRGGCI
ncbi:hypothetical protein [Photobacterium profundum]|uniref:hypothetical protein n=1 Tax=Photobacterium profundum TaxID=74109 RepID=UPI000304CBE8|nr:hypothetical protein [Photobacterium profundum]